MTREQAVRWLKDYRKNTDMPMESYEEALDMAITALEREQMGEWIVESAYIKEGDSEPFYRHDAKCNKCGYGYSLISTSEKFESYKVCPNCGANMKGDNE